MLQRRRCCCVPTWWNNNEREQYKCNTGRCVSTNPREHRLENDTFNASESNSWNLSRRSGGQPDNLCILSATRRATLAWISSKTQKRGLEQAKRQIFFGEKKNLCKCDNENVSIYMLTLSMSQPMQYLCQAWFGSQATHIINEKKGTTCTFSLHWKYLLEFVVVLF